MTRESTVYGVTSLASSVIQDLHRENMPFCDACAKSHKRIRKILTAYEPGGAALDSICHGNHDGHCECCAKFKWAVDRAGAYADKLDLEWRDIIAAWEEHRSYWYMNYYQEANQPDLDGDRVFVFDDLEEFRNAVGDSGFTCPKCGNVSASPYECTADKCDWKSYGFFGCMGKGAYVFVKSEMLGETMFMPVAFDGDES